MRTNIVYMYKKNELLSAIVPIYITENTVVGPALAKISYTSFGLASIISHFHLRIHAQLGGKQTGGPLADIYNSNVYKH